MALNIEGKKCPICNSYLFPEDDIVFCPICGAPHHRDCYKTIGHCGLEDKHGTDEQYDKQEQAAKSEPTASPEPSKEKNSDICPNCKNELTPDMNVCPYCGRPRKARIIAFDMLGGVDKNTELDNGVTAGEAAKFVQVNTIRYIPKFMNLKFKKASWNWMAFFFPEGWFFSRKMNKLGFLFISIIVAAQICLLPMTMILNTVSFSSESEIFNYILANFKTFDRASLILAIIGSVLNIAVKFIAGIFGDKFYRNHVISSVNSLKDDDDQEAKIKKQGGISMLGFLLGVLISTYASQIISMFF